jgi:sterol 3beta-glucosyltransferase
MSWLTSNRSQPFWANVVANAGAGPRPISQSDLTVDKLIEGIKFVMSSSAIQSAQAIAQKMRQESGVDSAVDSFYRWLPLEEMQCQILSSHTARWLLTAGKTRIRLSDAAVAALLVEKRIKLDKLKS